MSRPAPSRWLSLSSAATLRALPLVAQAQVTSPGSGDTAWMLAATSFVLLMIIPGLALFDAGLVRSKNVLSVLMQCFAITALISLL